MDFIVPIAITGIVFLAVYKVIYILATRKERLMFVEKLGQLTSISTDVASLQTIRSILGSGNAGNSYSPLRWGAGAIGAGLGLLIGIIISRSMGYEHLNYDNAGYVMTSSILLFTGLALVVAFAIEYRLRRNKSQE